MHVFEMIVIIVAVCSIVGLIKHWLDSRTQQAEQRDAGAQDTQREKIAELQERIRILETIVTDGNYELNKQFKELEG